MEYIPRNVHVPLPLVGGEELGGLGVWGRGGPTRGHWVEGVRLDGLSCNVMCPVRCCPKCVAIDISQGFYLRSGN